MTLTPVIDPDLEGSLPALAHLLPGVRVLFAARDETLLSELERVFSLPLHDMPVLITNDNGVTMISVAPSLGGLGLLLTLVHREDGDTTVFPTFMTLDPGQTAPRVEGFAQPVIDAFDSLLLRRCVQTGGVQ
jgi:hypothetical protein